jgi:hypothetical protein
LVSFLNRKGSVYVARETLGVCDAREDIDSFKRIKKIRHYISSELKSFQLIKSSIKFLNSTGPLAFAQRQLGNNRYVHQGWLCICENWVENPHTELLKITCKRGNGVPGGRKEVVV